MDPSFILTPEQLEKAARVLCKHRGIDPDEDASTSMRVYSPLWKECTAEIQRTLEVFGAIHEVMDPANE